MKKQIQAILLLFLFLFSASSLEADVWSRMFKVQHFSDSPQDQFNYGFQIGYDEVMNGVQNYLPSYDPFGQGYVAGRQKAYQDVAIANGYNPYGGQVVYQQPIIRQDIYHSYTSKEDLDRERARNILRQEQERNRDDFNHQYRDTDNHNREDFNENRTR